MEAFFIALCIALLVLTISQFLFIVFVVLPLRKRPYGHMITSEEGGIDWDFFYSVVYPEIRKTEGGNCNICKSIFKKVEMSHRFSKREIAHIKKEIKRRKWRKI